MFMSHIGKSVHEWIYAQEILIKSFCMIKRLLVYNLYCMFA